jgi:hypothetical protein
MTERPILFSGPMVRAILAGTKTQTRRLVTGLDPMWLAIAGWRLRPPNRVERDGALWDALNAKGDTLGSVAVICPYGAVGGRLWVRETWVPLMGEDQPDGHPNVVYAAHAFNRSSHLSGVDRLGSPREVPLWRPSIHMPRWASRLTLEVTDVRVQRLQEISEEDAKAEGVEPPLALTEADVAEASSDSDEDRLARALGPGSFSNRFAFEMLWQEINRKRAHWDSNPWVWAVTFRSLQ